MAQVAYVKPDATGSGDGSSWANAFTNLHDALVQLEADSIWIAQGEYKPGTDTSAYFFITRPVALYGGFNGSESSLDERQPEVFVSVISGDLLGDDLDDNFVSNKTDNARHLFVVPEGLAGQVVLDGLTVSYAFNRDALAGAPELYYRGAGVYARSPVLINNCRFTQNRGGSGCAVYMSGPASSGSVISQSFFERNLASGQAVVFSEYSNDLRVVGCRFAENQANRGGLYPAYGQNITIEDCSFIENVNALGYGGAAFFWQDEGVVVRRCLFRSNRAPNAAGLYIDARELTEVTTDNFKIEDCTFEDNLSSSFGGGGIYVFRAGYQLRRSVFSGNRCTNSGGAIIHGGDDSPFVIDSCSFFNNAANYGGALTNYNTEATGLISHCLFEGNEALTSGGVSINGFKARVNYLNCTFSDNTARWGGAIYVQNDSTEVSWEACNFYGNQSDNFGGAIHLAGGISAVVDRCLFDANASNFGGGISFFDGDADLAELYLNRSFFSHNEAGAQGGGISLSDVDANIRNCVFVANLAEDPGIGGGLSVNNREPGGALVEITNCTIADNIGLLAGGIASWATDTVTSVVRLQNTVLHNDGPNYAVEGGNPELLSGGGNFVTDLSALESLNAATDQNGDALEPAFNAVSELDYSPAPGSPLINAGEALGAPAEDILGSPRDGTPDIGAYELVGVASHQPRVQPQQLLVSPNPARAVTYLGLPDDWSGPLLVRLYTADGKLVWQTQSTAVPRSPVQLHLPHLPQGWYRLSAQQGHQTRVGSLLLY